MCGAEVFDLFDDVLLLAEGHIVFHGPKDEVPKRLACRFSSDKHGKGACKVAWSLPSMRSESGRDRLDFA